MKYNFVTIEREFGSGGTKIAGQLAKECGINCYGKEILEAVSKKYDISVDQINRYEENVTNSFLYSIFVISRASSGDTDMLASEGHIYVAEQAIIKQLAAGGPAVFLGHCASEALKDRKGVLKVFIRATEDDKTWRTITDYGIPESSAAATMKRYNKKRANYYYANTARKWDDYKNYDMILNSSSLGIDGCVAALKGLITA